MPKTPEGIVSDYAKAELKKNGCLVRKIGYEMRRGCPDLLILIPGGRVIFAELKKDENTEPEPHQLREHARMRAAGADVRVIGSKTDVDALVEELFPC